MFAGCRRSRSASARVRFSDQTKPFETKRDEPSGSRSVCTVARGRDVCLLAGTGYGKTRIAESFRILFKQSVKVIVLVLNPLDALGDNQVE